MPSKRERLRDGGKGQHTAPEGPDISVEPLKYHPGDTVADKYRLEELKGQGAMGSVWRATNLALGVDVAVKLVHGEIVSTETADRLQREAHAAARIEHPSAVRIFDFGHSHLGDPFIAMELLRGESLREVFDARGKIPAIEAVGLLLPVMSALVAAHQKGIIHRDLKPENIVIVKTEEGIVPKLVDFGLAKIESISTQSTSSGVLVGSPDYMSPEQARAESELVGPASDVWSIGVILYEAVAGTAPFQSTSLFALLRAINQEAPPPIDPSLADGALTTIIGRALEKDPKARWPSMRAFGKALAEWALARGADVDAAGNSIAAHWTRGARASVASLPDERPSLASPLLTPEEPQSQAWRSDTGAAVWQPSPPEKSGSRWGLIGLATLGVAIAGGGVAFAALRRSSTAPPPAQARAATPSPESQAHASATPSTDATVPATPSTPASVLASASASAPALASAPASASASAPSSASAPAPASASALAPAPASASAPAPSSPSACLAALFPDDSFVPSPSLTRVCSEPDPRKAAAFLHQEIARHGLLTNTTTAGMRLWANLSWYELAVVATARGACCDPASSPAIDLPPSVGTCPSLAAVLEALTKAVRARQGVEESVVAFREAALCFARGNRINEGVESPYDYQGAPGGGAESAFRKVLERAAPH